LGDRGKALELLGSVLREDPNHLQAMEMTGWLRHWARSQAGVNEERPAR